MNVIAEAKVAVHETADDMMDKPGEGFSSDSGHAYCIGNALRRLRKSKS
jgi:hypothetical protein